MPGLKAAMIDVAPKNRAQQALARSKPGGLARIYQRCAGIAATILSVAVLVTACGDQLVSAEQRYSPIRETAPMKDDPVTVPTAPDTIRITGIRATQGNAVDCPTIRDDAGRLHPVSYLSTGLAIGDRVTVSGAYGIITTCRGTVLVVAQEHPPEN